MEMASIIEMASGEMFARRVKMIHTEDQSQISIFWYTNNKVKEDNCPFSFQQAVRPSLATCTTHSHTHTKAIRGVFASPISAHSNTFPYFNTNKVIRFPAPSVKQQNIHRKVKTRPSNTPKHLPANNPPVSYPLPLHIRQGPQSPFS